MEGERVDLYRDKTLHVWAEAIDGGTWIQVDLAKEDWDWEFSVDCYSGRLCLSPDLWTRLAVAARAKIPDLARAGGKSDDED